MAIYHCTTKVISRGAGQSAVAKAAYNARARLDNERVGQVCDYSRGGFSKVLFSGIFAPKEAPEWVHDRQQLWNRVEAAEDKYNRKASVAQLAREVEFSLPYELTDQQREWLVKDYIREQFTRHAMIADVHIHAPDKDGDPRNYHCHVLLTLRELDGDDFSADKNRTWNQRGNVDRWREVLAEKGAKMLHRAAEEAERHNDSERGAVLHTEAERFRWGHKSLEEQRAKALERDDLEFAVLCDREPTTHRGPHLQVIEIQDRTTERSRNLRVANENDVGALNELRTELAAVERELIALQREPTTEGREDSSRSMIFDDMARAAPTIMSPDQGRLGRRLAGEIVRDIGRVADVVGEVGTSALDKTAELLGGATPLTPQQRGQRAAEAALQAWKSGKAAAEQMVSSTQSIDRDRWMHDAEYRKQVMANERLAQERELQERLERERQEYRRNRDRDR